MKQSALKEVAQQLKNAGRGGDTELVHVNKKEEEMLRRMGGLGSVNPTTGLKEYKGGGESYEGQDPSLNNILVNPTYGANPEETPLPVYGYNPSPASAVNDSSAATGSVSNISPVAIWRNATAIPTSSLNTSLVAAQTPQTTGVAPSTPTLNYIPSATAPITGGYELSKLMRQYGVASPSMAGRTEPTVQELPAASTATAPTIPTKSISSFPEFAAAILGAAPQQKTMLNQSEVDAYNAQRDAYNNAMDTYNSNVGAYNAALNKNAAYNADYSAYKDEYNRRLSQGNMYGAPLSNDLLQAPTYARGGGVHTMAKKYADGGLAETQTQATGLSPSNTNNAPPGSDPMSELQAARQSAKAEQDAFAKMLEQSWNNPDRENASKAELYFRLASAFGAPTKSGTFGETLGNVGAAMTEGAKGIQEQNAEKMKMQIAAQQLRSAGAKEELAAAKAIAIEEMKAKRLAEAEKLKPQSQAGQIAADIGLKPGTNEYFAEVKQQAALNRKLKEAQINQSYANAAASRVAAQDRQVKSTQLSPAQQKRKDDIDNNVSLAKQNVAALQKVIELNKNSYPTSGFGGLGYLVLSTIGSNDPRTRNTEELRRTLDDIVTQNVKNRLGSQFTQKELQIVRDVYGGNATSIEARNTRLRSLLESAATRLGDYMKRQEEYSGDN